MIDSHLNMIAERNSLHCIMISQFYSLQASFFSDIREKGNTHVKVIWPCACTDREIICTILSHKTWITLSFFLFFLQHSGLFVLFSWIIQLNKRQIQILKNHSIACTYVLDHIKYPTYQYLINFFFFVCLCKTFIV